jgi:hypothetical protein
MVGFKGLVIFGEFCSVLERLANLLADCQANILIRANGQAVVAGFGLSKVRFLNVIAEGPKSTLSVAQLDIGEPSEHRVHEQHRSA